MTTKNICAYDQNDQAPHGPWRSFYTEDIEFKIRGELRTSPLARRGVLHLLKRQKRADLVSLRPSRSSYWVWGHLGLPREILSQRKARSLPWLNTALQIMFSGSSQSWTFPNLHTRDKIMATLILTNEESYRDSWQSYLVIHERKPRGGHQSQRGDRKATAEKWEAADTL